MLDLPNQPETVMCYSLKTKSAGSSLAGISSYFSPTNVPGTTHLKFLINSSWKNFRYFASNGATAAS